MSNSLLAAAARPIRMRTRLGNIEYLDIGQGPVIVTLHGAMGGCDQSLLLARAALGDAPYRVLAVSRPGYAGTPLQAGKTLEAQADLVAALLDALDIERASVVAISGGGPCALHFALRHPERCRALVMISAPTSQHVTAPAHIARLRFMRMMTWLPFVEIAMRQAMRRDPAAAARSIGNADLRRNTLKHPQARRLMQLLMESTMTCMAARMRGTMNDIAQCAREQAPPLERLAMPVLGIYGTDDSIVPPCHGEALRAAMAGDVMLCKGGEHMSLFTHLDAVRDRIAAFLTGSG